MIYRYDIAFDQTYKKMYVQSVNQYLNPNLSGTLYSIDVCPLGVAVACADCPSPFVAVFDQNFN